MSGGASATSAVKPLRVCFYVYFPSGGIGRYTRELARALNELPDVEVEVACMPDFAWQNSDEYQVWPHLQRISDDVSLLRRARFLAGQFVNPVRFIEHAKATGADVLHFSNVNHLSYPYWRPALRRSGIPFAISVHDVQRQKRIVNRRWEDAQLKALYREADILFVHSNYQADELRAWAGVDADRVQVVPHGPYPHGKPTADRDALRRKLGLPMDRQVALFFGQLRDEKNLDGFMQALAMSDEPVHLLVAGQGGGRHHDGAYYRSLAGTLGIEDRVTFLDRFIPDDDVADLFTAADWVALPYRNTFTSQSGVLNVAAHYERPVLTTTSPVLSETVREEKIGIVCEGDDDSALRAGIELIAKMAQNDAGKNFAAYRERYSWEANAKTSRDSYLRISRTPQLQSPRNGTTRKSVA